MYESDSETDNAALTGLLQKTVGLLAADAAGLVTDIDGTIAPIVAHPQDAIVLPAARQALARLRDRLRLVAVVTGRGAADARQLVGVDGLTYIGNHGLETWTEHGPELVVEARPWVPRLEGVLGDVQRALDQSSVDPRGVMIENKRATASLHYRLAPDPDTARRELLQILARCAVTSGLRVEEGRRVINLLPPLTVTKGSAVTRLVRAQSIERVVYLGDDITDIHAFKALTHLRESSSGRIQTLSIGVVGPETALVVRQLADATVPSVTAAADLLQSVSERLKASATMISGARSLGRT